MVFAEVGLALSVVVTGFARHFAAVAKEIKVDASIVRTTASILLLDFVSANERHLSRVTVVVDATGALTLLWIATLVVLATARLTLVRQVAVVVDHFEASKTIMAVLTLSVNAAITRLVLTVRVALTALRVLIYLIFIFIHFNCLIA